MVNIYIYIDKKIIKQQLGKKDHEEIKVDEIENYFVDTIKNSVKFDKKGKESRFYYTIPFLFFKSYKNDYELSSDKQKDIIKVNGIKNTIGHTMLSFYAMPRSILILLSRDKEISDCCDKNKEEMEEILETAKGDDTRRDIINKLFIEKDTPPNPLQTLQNSKPKFF